MTVLSCEEWHVKDKRSESQFNLTLESIKEKYLVVFRQVISARRRTTCHVCFKFKVFCSIFANAVVLLGGLDDLDELT